MWSITEARGTGTEAMFVRLAAAIVVDIRRGALRAGDRLPSTRAVAGALGINRNTVVAAYDEVVAQGWAASRGAAGTYVTDAPVDRTSPRGRRAGMAATAGFELDAVGGPLTPVMVAGARFQLSAGIPDPRLFPRAIFARAYRRAMRSPAAVAALGYADARGAPQLREAIAKFLRGSRAIPVGAENILICRGSQQGIDLAARLLFSKRVGVAAVEALGYQPAWRAFAASGARLAGVAVDEHGLVVDAIPRGARCVYATPHHQYPTTVLLAQPRRLALLARAAAERFAILEDDYDHEFHYDGRPVAPLASADRAGNVIYLGTLSKILAPGLRLGFVAAPAPVIDALAAIRGACDRQGDHVLELAVADLLEDGEIQRHANKLRRIYAARRDAFADILTRELRGAVTFTLPAGGITLWARVAEPATLSRWRTRALAAGVAIATDAEFSLTRSAPCHVRLAFGRYTEPELREAVRILARTRVV